MSDQPTQKSLPVWILIAFQMLIVVLSIAIGYFGRQIIDRFTGDYILLRQAHDILLENTILDLPADPALEHGMIRGMLAVVDDPYTGFVEPADHEILTNELTGHFGGIGVRMERDTQARWRLYPLPDSPALAAGIQEADLLLAIDNLMVTEETDQATLLAAVRGPEGEPVIITVNRDQRQLSFTIQRASIPLPSVAWHQIPEAPQIGFLHVYRIAESTADEMEAGIHSLLDEGAQAVIIDLRDNGGGLVDAGVDAARLFLESGMVIQQIYAHKPPELFQVDRPGPFSELPLVLLINANTASSAEILAGALKAQQRATLVGTVTHGKTSIQSIFELSDGSSVHITSGRWEVASMEFPLMPDLVIAEDPHGVVILQTAISVLSQQLQN